MDGSGNDSHIGTEAIPLDGTTSRQYKLGTIMAHTVFEAKLIGVFSGTANCGGNTPV